MDVRKTMAAKKSRSQDPAKLSNKEECGTQTDTHFVESYIDKSYEWNEWILRRKALQLADLCNKSTHSSQTHTSNWRKDDFSQASESKYMEHIQEVQEVKQRKTAAQQHHSAACYQCNFYSDSAEDEML